MFAIFGVNTALANGTKEKPTKAANTKAANTKAAKKTAPAKHPKTVRITVRKNGFSPASVDVEEGFPVTLIFKRKDNQGCGNKVVFPSLGITKNLPVGKPVTVKFTPQKSGDVAFTCGMGMYKGNIVVSEG